ncbi:hypothetical protein LSAT2_001406, partial [Lamellibrachia satsuma]
MSWSVPFRVVVTRTCRHMSPLDVVSHQSMTPRQSSVTDSLAIRPVPASNGR